MKLLILMLLLSSCGYNNRYYKLHDKVIVNAGFYEGCIGRVSGESFFKGWILRTQKYYVVMECESNGITTLPSEFLDSNLLDKRE